jgi:hypothetical protein
MNFQLTETEIAEVIAVLSTCRSRLQALRAVGVALKKPHWVSDLDAEIALIDAHERQVLQNDT